MVLLHIITGTVEFVPGVSLQYQHWHTQLVQQNQQNNLAMVINSY